VEATEKKLEGKFCGIPVRGKADLVLRRGDELAILDIKWSGTNRRKELIRNEEDLQLVLYAHLLPPENYWPHTAYFILEDGKLVARNNQAFKQALQASAGADHAAVGTEIFERMQRTYLWRMLQISNGAIEIRTERTAMELEALYEGHLVSLLEMKREDARYDDYRGLL
jgi:ATP-dependent helicase/nuclease subunit B